MSFTIDKGIIHSNGLPVTPRWFCDGRTAIEVDNETISEINYFSENSNGTYIVFRKCFWSGINLFLDKKRVVPENCTLYPFGFFSSGNLGEYSVWLGEDKIHISVIPKNNTDVFRLEFNNDFIFIPEGHPKRDTRLGGMPREWSPVTADNGIVKLSYKEGEAENYVTFASNKELSLSTRERNGKIIISAENIGTDKCEIVISLSSVGFVSYTDDADLLERQLERYNSISEKSPILKSKHEYLNKFFELAPLYHESLKTTDVSGAIRAQSTHYWVWGWDSMTSNECSFYWGDMEFIGEMLDCMEKYSVQGEGISHAFARDMSASEIAPATAQGMYITLLDFYKIAGGDYKRHFPFAKQIFEMIAKTEVRDTGLCKGTSLYPDFRNLIGETGNDISSFNNTVSYCAVRSMQDLAKDFGDIHTEKKAKDLADRMQKNYQNIMFNKEVGFFDSSVEADSYAYRFVPSNNAVKWENGYCRDLIIGKEEESLAFYEKHLLTDAGILPVPRECKSFDADSNQLHCWWTVMSEFYTRLVNTVDRSDLMEKYIKIIEYWTEKLMCPEGIPCYADRADVPFDNWNCLCGIWHGYSIRGFYNAVIHNYIGVDFNKSGVNFYPYSGDEVCIENLHFGKYTFNIKMQGSGKNIKNINLNGKDLGGIKNIPFEKLASDNYIEVTRI